MSTHDISQEPPAEPKVGQSFNSQQNISFYILISCTSSPVNCKGRLSHFSCKREYNLES